MHRSPSRPGQGLSELYPAIVRLGLARLRPQQDDAFWEALERLDDLGDVLHEDLVVGHEVVRRQDYEDGLGILSHDPVGRQQDGRRGPAILGLLQDMRHRRLVAQLRRHVRALPSHGHHDRSLGGNQEADPIERLTQEGFEPSEHGILLGSVLAVQVPGQRSQSHSLATCEHDSPGMGWAVIVWRLLHCWLWLPADPHHEDASS